jgi:hypothetical protein
VSLIAVDYHPSFQTIAFDQETGECGEQELVIFPTIVGSQCQSAVALMPTIKTYFKRAPFIMR